MPVVDQPVPTAQKARPTPSVLPLGEAPGLLPRPYDGGGGCNLVTGALLLNDGRPSVLAICVVAATSSLPEKTPELGTLETGRPLAEPPPMGLTLPKSLTTLQAPCSCGVVSPVVPSMNMLYAGPEWPGGTGQVPSRPRPRGACRITIRTSLGSAGDG